MNKETPNVLTLEYFQSQWFTSGDGCWRTRGQEQEGLENYLSCPFSHPVWHLLPRAWIILKERKNYVCVCVCLCVHKKRSTQFTNLIVNLFKL